MKSSVSDKTTVWEFGANGLFEEPQIELIISKCRKCFSFYVSLTVSPHEQII